MLSFTQEWRDNAQTQLTLFLDGPLQYGKYDELRRFIFGLSGKGVTTVDVDLSNVDHIDSSGLGLVMVLRDMIGENGTINLMYPHSQVLQILEVCKLDKVANIILD